MPMRSLSASSSATGAQAVLSGRRLVGNLLGRRGGASPSSADDSAETGGEQRPVQRGGAPAHAKAAGQLALGAAAARHAVLHHAPDGQQAGVDLGVLAPVAFVGAHHLGNASALGLRLRQ